MLKFFREYNKYILVVGVALLMIAFLVGPTLSMFAPEPGAEVIGSIGDQQVTLVNLRQARSELTLLQDVAPVLVHLAGSGRIDEKNQALQWMLMLHDAKAMGLASSAFEINQLLLTMGMGEASLSEVAKRAKVSTTRVRQAIGNWIVVQAYRELVYGLTHMTIKERLEHYVAAGRFLQFGYYQGAAVEIESAFRGSPRLSKPLLTRFLQDNQATTQAVATVIPADRYLTRASQPDEQTLTDLFDRYKQSLPGQGKPYGLGYRVPDRVQIEYLEITPERVRERVRVDEADALSYYDSHQDEFREPVNADTGPDAIDTGDQTKLKPYTEVRAKILERLKNQKASELADRILKAAQAIMLEDARGLEQKDGYRVLPEEWEPLSMVDVAKQLHAQFDVLPVIHHHQDRWLTPRKLAALPGIAASQLPNQQKAVGFMPYVFSAKEWSRPEPIDGLMSLRLQAKMPSTTLVSPEGHRYLFRLVAVAPSRVPASLDEARTQVKRDAKRLEAFRLLTEESATWLEKAQRDGLETLASKENLQLIKPQPFSKRVSEIDGRLNVPDVPGIGREKAFVDGAFNLVDQALDATRSTNIETVPAAQRTDAVAVDGMTSLLLIRVDKVEPMTRSQFKNMASAPQVGAWINQSLTGDMDGSVDDDPLSIASLSSRVGYVPAYDDDADDPEDGNGG